MYPQYDHHPDRILRSVNPPSPSPSHPPPSPNPIRNPNPDNPHFPSINTHIATYLRSPTPTWLAVQKAKAAGAHDLVYYYEPSDRYVHFAATGVPVHDLYYFDGEAGFFVGEEGVVEGEEREEDGLGGGGEICGGGDRGASGGKEGGEGVVSFVEREGNEEGEGGEICPEGDGDVWSGYDCEWDLYQPFGMVERPVGEWMAGKGDGSFALRDVNASSGAEEGISGFGDWQDAWDEFFK